ncbi:hypothetical protein W03_01820 [Nitrosomonas sp. PY1]|uniref:hypothetical protein n=1 Tax=Nitrosomonas sp. PY1 TaxID=1803906 RepID=UPI001FC7F93F|nr:hypothetical protein [Nitrosomonas sp. PY1]GKS68178.1 hypothetical protein W03_01820 [Nitrosomonas sp. PY1]
MKTKLSINLLAILLLIGGGIQTVLAHNSFKAPRVKEGPTSWNAIVFGHGCGENTIVGSSVVFPNFSENPALQVFNASSGAFEATEDTIEMLYDTAAAPFSYIIDRSVFPAGGVKVNDSDEAVGMWVGGGEGVPHSGSGAIKGFISVGFQPGIFVSDSCAAQVQFVLPMADVCKITTIGGFKDGVVSLWMPDGVDTEYVIPGSSHGGELILTVERNLTSNKLPESCKEQKIYKVVPTAKQINTYMPVIINGKRVWPRQ